jgi:exodeoxyribonuclease-3
MKIISWNVNGLRAVMKKGFDEFLKKHDPDILCLQEIKIDQPQAEQLPLPFPYKIYNSADKKGYSGTAVFSKQPLDAIMTDIEGHEDEGRVITVDVGDYYVVNVYVPNSGIGLRRLKYRYTHWDPDFMRYLKQLQKRKPVICVGDLNVAHKEIDLENPSANRKTAGFTDQEREGFDNLLKAGLVDSFRHLYPDKEKAYSWWSYRTKARDRNVGWRIDYCLVSKNAIDNVKKAFILDDVLGSDHCPVGVVMK